MRTTFVDRSIAWLLSSAIFIEVGLIAMQQWRGVPSHFNFTTTFDAWVLFGIKLLVFFVTLAIVHIFYRSLGPLNLAPDYVASARGGMLLLVVACLISFVIEYQGERLAQDGLSPSIYGKAGVLKFPHGMPLHAIQYLPATAWILTRLGASMDQRLISVWSMFFGISGLTLFALLQSYAGRSRFDVSFSTGLLLAVSAAFFLPTVSSGLIAAYKDDRVAKGIKFTTSGITIRMIQILTR